MAGKDVNEFMAELEADPEYQARAAAADAEHERRVARIREESAPVVQDLVQAGFDVEFVEDLYEQDRDYSAAVPVLLRWLPRVESRDVKEGIIRALSIEYARPVAARPLVDELRAMLPVRGQEADDMRWVVANALDVVADDTVLDDLLALMHDERLDVDGRALLLRALGNMQDPRAVEHVLQVLREGDQHEVPLLISGVIALRRLRSTAGRDLVERYTQHSDRELRKEAERTLKAIDRAPRTRRGGR